MMKMASIVCSHFLEDFLEILPPPLKSRLMIPVILIIQPFRKSLKEQGQRKWFIGSERPALMTWEGIRGRREMD